MTSMRFLKEGVRGWAVTRGECGQIYAVLEAEAGKVVRVAVEGLSVEDFVAVSGQVGVEGT